MPKLKEEKAKRPTDHTKDKQEHPHGSCFTKAICEHRLHQNHTVTHFTNNCHSQIADKCVSPTGLFHTHTWAKVNHLVLQITACLLTAWGLLKL